MIHSNVNSRVRWFRDGEDVGVKACTFRTCGTTGNTLSAATGASLRELMNRMGHGSTGAAYPELDWPAVHAASVAIAMAAPLITAEPSAFDGAAVDVLDL